MAEDENVDMITMNSELAERLGVISSSNPGAAPKPGFRARGCSPLLNASTTSRVNCPPRCRSRDSSENILVPELTAFVHMLPQEIATADQQRQALLFRLVFDAGVKAYHHLLQYVIATGTSGTDSTSSNSSEASWTTSKGICDVPLMDGPRKNARLPSIDSEAENLSMMERIDHAYETMIEVGDADISPVGNAPEATPQLVANTLGLFAGAALRRPPTRVVECVMAASQESNTAQSDVDRHDIYENSSNVPDNSYTSCEDGLLTLACAAGFVDLVAEILSLRNSTLFSADSEVTPLMEAAAAGSTTVVKKLIEMGADINRTTRANNTAILYAAAAGHAECVRLLLDVLTTCDISIRNENGHDALMEAASSGNVEIVRMLIDRGATPSFINMHSEFKESPLTLAAYKGHVDVVTFLLELSKTRSDILYQEEEMHTALMEASMDGHYEVARVLLDAGALPNMANEAFESPLTLACCGGHDVLAKMLLDAGAYIEEPNDESYTPLMEAAREGHVSVVKVLLAHGANVNAQTEETGETALTVAACGGYTEVVEELVNHGGDLELGGNTPLMEAAQEGHAQTVMYIVKVSTTITNRCPNFQTHASTAVGLAAENGHLDVIEILLTAGADLNTEIDGRTPLMKACKNGNILIVQYLLSHDVNVNTQSSHQDATALLLACAAGHKDIVRMLLNHGADPNIELKDGISCVLEAARNGFVEIVEIMLDHSGVPANAPAYVPNVVKPPQPPTTTCTNQNSVKMPMRRKKVCSKSVTAPPDPTINGPPIYSPIFQGTPQHIEFPRSHVDINQNPDFAREYYSWLAGIYNSRIGNESAFISTMLPSDLTIQQIMVHLDNLQKMMQQLAQQDSNWVKPDHIEFAMHRARQQVERVQKESWDIANGVKVPDSKATGIAASSAKFLASIYELGKKNFAGLPLPASLSTSQMHNTINSTSNPPCQSTVSNVNIPSTQNIPSSVATSTQTAMSITGSMSMEQVAEIMAFFKTNPNQDGEDIISQLTSSLPPEHRRATRKKFMEIFNNWEEFSEECRKICPDIVKTASSTELSTFLEQQTAILNETLKVLRPTVTSLPGGIVTTPTPAVSLPPAASNPPPPSHTHRRTHSEGDESDSLRQSFTSKGTFNVDKATESNNDTPLTAASSNGHKDLIPVLIARGANIEHRDKKGFTSLILAATGGHVGAVQALLDAGANIEAQSERTKDTALSLACSGGRKEVVELLLSKGANKEHRNVSDYTPLSLAASGGYVDIVNLLLNAGAEINSRTGSKLGISPLMLAAMNGHKDATRVLLERGSDINAQIETNRNTALTLACFQGRTDVVRLLLQYNANVEHRAKTGLTPLMEAANGGYVEVGELLLENYADPNTVPVPSSRDTALTIAADKGHDKFVEMLLRHGAVIDARNKKGCTALWLGCHGGHLDTVQVLVRHNADVDAQDNRKVSPLMIAFRKGFVRIVQYLVNHVKQYPSDQEMERYMATLTATESGKVTKEVQDLVKNCTDSMNIIKRAKTAQAQQADKAAEDLLALLAEEEERAKTKKQKKAKKREEKKQKQKEAKAKSPATGVDDESEEESEVNNTSRDEIPNVPSDPRVPQVVQNTIVPIPQEISQTKQKKQTRRSRQESGKSVAVNPPISSLTISTNIKVNAVSPVSPIAQSKASPTDEWVKANPNKKKTTQKKCVAIPQPKVQDFFSDESGAFGGWKDVELSRRRSNTLTVCNTVIARVIGRGGANINAIREATGASIEVEKQNTRRDQTERQICIRGTAETVRNATYMINGLIADHDANVTDIIRQVTKGNTSVASSSSESGGKTLEKALQLEKPEKQMTTVSSTKTTVTATPSQILSQSSGTTTNVWQQRMAARAAMQQAQTKESVTSLSPTNPDILNKATFKSSEENQSLSLNRPVSPVISSSLTTSIPNYNTEEELRKAPGYRPMGTAPNVPIEPVAPVQLFEKKREEPLLEEKQIPPIGHGFARAPGTKIGIVEESVMTKSATGRELGSLSFLEKPEIADIWKGDGKESVTNEPAWGGQLLLGNGLGNMLGNLNLGASDWTNLASTEFTSSLPTSGVLTKPTVSTSTYDWMGTNSASVSQSNSLYSRSNTASRLAPILPTASTAPADRESAIYQQLAAQLLNQQNGSNQQNPSYYSSNSYPENTLGSFAQQSAAHKSYMQAYQNANQEYESLNNLLNSYNNASHYNSANGDYGQGYTPTPAASRTIPSRPSNYPPPGFAGVTPTAPGINSNAPVVPHMRSYYNAPNSQIPNHPQNSSAFSAYGQQPTQNWSKLNTNGASGSNWNAGSWN